LPTQRNPGVLAELCKELLHQQKRHPGEGRDLVKYKIEFLIEYRAIIVGCKTCSLPGSRPSPG
jgi:hypothetical protein